MQKINLQFKFNPNKLLDPLKNILAKIPWFIAKRSFVLFWVGLIIIIAIDGVIFYRYLWKVDSQKITIESKQISIDDNSYNTFLDNYAARKKLYNRGSLEIHNIFFR